MADDALTFRKTLAVWVAVLLACIAAADLIPTRSTGGESPANAQHGVRWEGFSISDGPPFVFTQEDMPEEDK